ncbi:hypothetical protein PVK06_001076 [Gossypium arboreum]|uniref:Uncharacterized protein n=1 Tax=Gossypium arboreum TaxID=29729 RepID=A0ABR0R030_GOSAR|nr:hypothetical protein PVK06_001076 [Gossypium arboreum]
MIEFDDPEMVQFNLDDLVCKLSMPEFGVVLGLYTEELMNDDDFDSLHRYIHCSSSNCWKALVPTSASYDPSCSKTSTLAPPLRYLYVILTHTLTGRRESTDVVNTNDTYFYKTWRMGTYSTLLISSP